MFLKNSVSSLAIIASRIFSGQREFPMPGPELDQRADDVGILMDLAGTDFDPAKLGRRGQRLVAFWCHVAKQQVPSAVDWASGVRAGKGAPVPSPDEARG